MPLPQQNCSISDNVCCTVLFDIAQFILNTVYDGLVTCLPGECDPLLRYVTMGNGDDGVADSLTVAFQGATASPKSSDNNGRLLPVTLMRGRFDVRLREKGWPIIRTEGGQLSAPDPTMQQAMARHAYAHGEKMYRILRYMGQERKVTPAGMPKPAFIRIGDLLTLNPSGGIVGFVASVELDLPWGQQGF